MWRHVTAALVISLFSIKAWANNAEEIIVTAQTRAYYAADDMDDDAPRIPAITLRRTADFVIRTVQVVSDTRDKAKRSEEIYQTLKNTIELADQGRSISIAIGDTVVEALDLKNYKKAVLKAMYNKTDTDFVSILLKTPLQTSHQDAKTVLDDFDNFIKKVKVSGRAELIPVGDMALSVVNPEQYRYEIIKLIAADAEKTTAFMGTGYAVEIDGISQPVRWALSGLTELQLYIPYSLRVVPR